MKSLSENSFWKKYNKFSTWVLIIAGLLLIVTILPQLVKAKRALFEPLPTWEVNDPVSKVFVMDEIPPTAGSLAAGDSTVPNEHLVDPAIDTLLLMMETQDIYLHQTALQPSGIVSSDDIVIIKGNFQAEFRNTTSTDRIKGVIWRILQHPDGFTGEILVGDNTQYSATITSNNSEDTDQTILDVINTFYSKGYPVYLFEWKDITDIVVTEYSEGDYNDGFTYNSTSKVSYPKFQSPSSDYYISLHYGIWDSTLQEYDLDKLCIIDFPVLKAHGDAGATIAVKNWVGALSVTKQYERYGGSHSMHYQYLFGEYALVAKVMSETFPKLTIVDAAWTNMERNYGNNVINTKMLFASTDPVAVSWYSAKYALTPIAIDPERTNPDNVGGWYGECLNNWTNCLQDSGFSITKDSSEISVYNRADLSVTSSDNIVDQLTPRFFQLSQNYPNPFNSQTVITFDLLHSANLQLHIYDTNGGLVKSLIKGETRDEGTYQINWDGTNNQGQILSSGVYFYKLIVGDFSETKSMILEK